jgi:hypothetical protein
VTEPTTFPVASEASLTNATTTNSQANGRPPPHIVQPFVVHQPERYSAAMVSDLDDMAEDENALDSSAASLVAQAALDAAEHHGEAETSPPVSATALPSLSATPSQGLQSLVPQSGVDTALPRSQRSHTQIHVRERGESMTMPEDTPLRTAVGVPESRVADTEDDNTVESRMASSQPMPHDTPDVVEGTITAAGTLSSTITGPRRQPLPPPTPSTNTTITQPSHSAMRPDDDDDDDSDGDDERILSKSETELTIEQQRAPATHGTFTYPTSVEAAQAAVTQSASLLPPTRSSSSGSSVAHDRNLARHGNQHHHHQRHHHSLHHNSKLVGMHSEEEEEGGGSVADTTLLSAPQRALERSGTLEEDEGGTLRSLRTLGGTPGHISGGGAITIMDLKHQQLLHMPSLQGETHGETQTAALATTATTGDESLSRLSVMLMPPSPSQPRASLSPHAASLTSSKASSAEVKPPQGGSSSAAALLLPPTPQHSDEEVKAATVTETAAVAGGGMRMAPAPSSSSSSSESVSRRSSGAHDGAHDDAHEADRSSNEKSGDAPQSSSASATAAAKQSLRIRAMPLLSSGDDEDEDSSDKAECVRPVDAERMMKDSSNSSSSSESHSLVTPVGSAPVSETQSASVKMSPQSYRFGDLHGANAEHAQKGVWTDGEPEEVEGDTAIQDEENNDVSEVDEDAERSAAVPKGDAEVDNSNELQESGRWNEVLKGMELIDCTLISRVYEHTTQGRTSESGAMPTESEEAGEDMCLFKVLSLFPVVASDERARWGRRASVQRRLLRLAQTMRDTQQALDDAGLTAAGVARSVSTSQDSVADEAGRPTRITCSGISAVYVDANCRLIAQLEAEPFMVPLRHLLPATCSTGLQESEIIALLRSVVCKVATMHNAGFVHGALHAGNVLLSSYDGDTVLTQPCGLMTQSSSLPSDLSVLSVARACAMASYLPKVWGARRLHVASHTSVRLGTPSRPDINELITYHNLAALGWGTLADEKLAEEAEEGEEDSTGTSAGGAAYTPTPADDLYALGMMAFLLYLGVPPFHMSSLWAAVERLGMLAGDYEAAVASSSRQEARRHIAHFCFGEYRQANVEGNSPSAALAVQLPELLTCGYGRLQRHAAGRLQPEFEQALQNFIVDCVEASCVDAISEDGVSATLSQDDDDAEDGQGSCGPHFRTAQELLDVHVLFQRFGPVNNAQDGESVEEQMRDTVHRVAYPAFCTWARARKECGSTPHLARMHSNAVYTARCTALCESLAAAAAGTASVDTALADAQQRHDTPQEPAALVAPLPTTTPDSLLTATCPEVAGDLQAWQPPFPSVGMEVGAGCCIYVTPQRRAGDDDEEGERWSSSESPSHAWTTDNNGVCTNAVAATAARDDVSTLIRPSAAAAPAWLTGSNEEDEEDVALDAAVTTATADDALANLLLHAPPLSGIEFNHYHHLHSLVLAEKQSASFALSRAFVTTRLSGVVDTLVLQRLQDCTVTLLAPFRYVILDDVVRCEVRLGPCEMCVLQDVRECPLVAVAAHHVAGTRVRETKLCWSGQGGRPPQLVDSHGVSLALYGLTYSGLTEDYKRVGLPVEHVASLRIVGKYANEVLRRSFELMATAASVRTQNEIALCLTPELPYAHAIIASGTRYVHRGSSALLSSTTATPGDEQHQQQQQHRKVFKGGGGGDVFHYYGELYEKDVLICDVHGDKGEEEGERIELSGGAARRPVVFLHDALGDVTVERCSFCTVAVVGTPSSLQVRDCHNCRLIIMAREAVLDRCAQVDCVALVTEYLLVRSCGGVRVRPLFLDCPFSDEVLRRVVMGSMGGQEEETMADAYEAGRFDLLNAVLRGVGQGITIEESEGVVVEDMHYYQSSNSDDNGDGGDDRWFSVVTVPYSAIHCKQQRERGKEKCSDASELMAEGAQVLAEHLSLPAYAELLQRYEDATSAAPPQDTATRHSVVFHDLLDCSILRLRGALCPVHTAEQIGADAAGDGLFEARGETRAATTDVYVERIHFGVLYIDDAVGTLRLRHCVGPLDVVVCAAATVIMEHCVGVQLRTACVDFRATDCVGCHVALHVNHRPQYQRCSSMETSVLNITATDLDVLLAAAGVDVEVNCFDTPLLLTHTWQATETAKPPAPALTAEAIHAYCTGAKAAAPSGQTVSTLLSILSNSASDSVGHFAPTQTPLIMAMLREPVTVVAPLPGLCVSPQQAAFVGELETLVTRWSCQGAPACRADVVAVALRALADVSRVYLDVPEWAATGTVAATGSKADAHAMPGDDEERGQKEEEPAETASAVTAVHQAQQRQAATAGEEEEEGETSSIAEQRETLRTTMAVAKPEEVEDTDAHNTGAVDRSSTASSGEVGEKDSGAHEHHAAVVEAADEGGVKGVDKDDVPQPLQVVVAVVRAREMRSDVVKAEVEERVVTVLAQQEEEEKSEGKWGGFAVEEVAEEAAQEGGLRHDRDRDDHAEAPHLDQAPPLAVVTTHSKSTRARSASDSGAVFVVSSPSPPTDTRHDEPHSEALVENVTPAIVVVAASVYRDPEAVLHVAAHADDPSSTVQVSGRILNTSLPPGQYSEPLPSQSPFTTSLKPSATSDRDNFNSVNALHATTAAPVIDTSVSSSVGVPPMAPRPAYALNATDVGASAAMDIFNPSYPSANISAAVEALVDDEDDDVEGELRSRHRAVIDEAENEGRPMQAYGSHSGPQPMLAETSPATAAALPAERAGEMERLQLGVPPLAATTMNSFHPDSEEDWAHSPRVDTPGSSRHSDSHGSPSSIRDGGGTTVDRQPTENAVTVAATRAAEVAQFLTPATAPVLDQHEGEVDDAVEYSRQTSSSVSDYPHRGVPACEDSARRGAGSSSENAARCVAGTRQATSFLHFSQDSSSRRGELSLTPSHPALNGTSPLVSPGDHRTAGSGSFAAAVPATPEAAGMSGVDASIMELVRQVEEARQRYGRRQQLLQQQYGVRSSETLKVRVKNAVAKLKAMKAREGVA